MQIAVSSSYQLVGTDTQAGELDSLLDAVRDSVSLEQTSAPSTPSTVLLRDERSAPSTLPQEERSPRSAHSPSQGASAAELGTGPSSQEGLSNSPLQPAPLGGGEGLVEVGSSVSVPNWALNNKHCDAWLNAYLGEQVGGAAGDGAAAAGTAGDGAAAAGTGAKPDVVVKPSSTGRWWNRCQKGGDDCPPSESFICKADTGFDTGPLSDSDMQSCCRADRKDGAAYTCRFVYMSAPPIYQGPIQNWVLRECRRLKLSYTDIKSSATAAGVKCPVTYKGFAGHWYVSANSWACIKNPDYCDTIRDYIYPCNFR